MSMPRGRPFGRYFAMTAAVFAAIGVLLDIPAYQFWSVTVFGLILWSVYDLTAPGPEDRRGEEPASVGPLISRGLPA